MHFFKNLIQSFTLAFKVSDLESADGIFGVVNGIALAEGTTLHPIVESNLAGQDAKDELEE